MKKLLLLFLCATCVWAAEAQKIVPLKYATADSVRSMLMVFGLQIQVSPELRAVALSGPEDRVNAAVEAIQKLDVPSAGPHSVDLTIYLVGGGPGTTPPELDGVIKQLRQTFNLKQYQLLDVVTLQMRSDRRNAEASGSNESGANYHVAIQAVSIVPGTPQTVRLSNFNFKMNQASLQTDVDIKEGQKVVIGKTGLKGPEQPLFVVVSAKVLE